MQIITTKGILQGADCGEYCVFRGVPYAKAPVGELRWKAPEEVERWDGIRLAEQFEKSPVQDIPDGSKPWDAGFYKEFYSNPEYIRELSEDGLYLNIWMPKDAEGKKLPVAFWIHGGGFAGGYSSEIEFDGEAFCRKGVILVTVEYRLNVFGFLAHPWLGTENETGASGNYGLMDQIAALKWVYENISAFGGDPDNITVFGQSAGSMSTQALVSSELTKGMIAKAIMQSGISCEKDLFLTPSLAEEEEFGKIFTEIAGVNSLEEMRAMTTEEIQKTEHELSGRLFMLGKGLCIVPDTDGVVLKKNVKETYAAGEMHQIPYMCGVVNDDLATTPEESAARRPGLLMEECQNWSLKCEEAFGKPAYVYYFNHPLPGDEWGACTFHSSELWYMFGSLGRCWRPMTEEDYRLSEEMVTLWTNFMKTGTPSEEWKPYSRENKYIKEFR